MCFCCDLVGPFAVDDKVISVFVALLLLLAWVHFVTDEMAQGFVVGGVLGLEAGEKAPVTIVFIKRSLWLRKKKTDAQI